MRCPNCDAENSSSVAICSNCQTPINKTRDEAHAADPRVAKMVSWSLITMGVLGLIFVIVNSGQSWHTALDYVGPIALLLVGGGSLAVQSRKANKS